MTTPMDNPTPKDMSEAAMLAIAQQCGILVAMNDSQCGIAVAKLSAFASTYQHQIDSLRADLARATASAASAASADRMTAILCAERNEARAELAKARAAVPRWISGNDVGVGKFKIVDITRHAALALVIPLPLPQPPLPETAKENEA